MRKLYSTKPTSDKKETERLTWQPVEEYAIGRAILVVITLALIIGLFILHLQFLFILAIATIVGMFTVFVMKDAHNKAFDRYWDYWQGQK